MTSRENRRLRNILSGSQNMWIDVTMSLYSEDWTDHFEFVKCKKFNELRKKLFEAMTEMSDLIYEHPACIADREEADD